MTLEQFQFEYNSLVMGGVDNPYMITSHSGFRGLPSTSQDDIAFAKQDGWIPGSQTLGQRTLELDMVVGSTATVSVEAALDALAVALAPVHVPSSMPAIYFNICADTSGAFIWLHNRFAYCVPLGPPTFDIDKAAAVGWYPVSLQFLASDPLIYLDEPQDHNFYGSQDLTNSGNYAVWPVISIAGPCDSLTLTWTPGPENEPDGIINGISGPGTSNGGKLIIVKPTFVDLLADGQVLWLDCLNHTCIMEDTTTTPITHYDFYGYLGNGTEPGSGSQPKYPSMLFNWPCIVPGTHSFAVSGTSGEIDVVFFSAWSFA